MNFSDEWKSLWPICSSYSPPLLLSNSHEESSSKRRRIDSPIEPLIFRPCEETVTLLLRSPLLSTRLPPPVPDLSLPRFLQTSSAHWSCDSNTNTHVQAHFNPGRITLDGQVDDWKDIDGSAFSVLPALDPDADKAYNGGKMTVKVSHDGKDVFFMLQVDGDYTYSEGYSNKTASVAFMFQIGENASYHRMGGCEEEPDTCTSKSCKGHEVDLMHFSLGKAIPGRLYGGNLLDNSEGNGGDRFGHLVDLYCWNPHCRFLDGYGPSVNDTTAQNDWKGTWWHSSLTHSGFIKDDSPYSSSNQSGAYYFEFSRPLRTMDRLQQDAQFTIGKASKMSVAFWYPMDGKPWHGSGHFSISCDWILLDILPDSSELTKVPQRSSWDAATAFSLLFSSGFLYIHLCWA